MMNPIKILWSLAFNATSESKPHIQIPITPPPSPSSDLKHKKSVSIRTEVASANPPSPRPVAANRAQPSEPTVVTKVDTEIQGLMSWDEHIMLIGHTVNCFGGSIKVIGDTGSNSTREAIHASEQGFAVGMHAALHINPYYGKTSIEGLISHFNCVLSMSPTIIYNVPGRTGQDIPPYVIQTIAESANLAGVKECVGNDRVEHYTKQGIVIWSGNDDQCHDARWNHGATGVISVTSNLVPGLMRELMFEGKNPSLNAKLLPLMDWLFCEPNPIGLNTALAQLGVVRPVFKLPYVPLPKAKREEFVKLVEQIGREHFVSVKDVQVLDDDDFILVIRY
ncbi:4-hydroxy-tetrahydrodipicolinate synthase [Cucumis melo var. makuwa]|uniref:4-hydroxy-tetrahydrodipicolinate synthase n=1 Tax=Cucumis melo var. makuwa TaxID=1194695 RepID=A0A5A7UWJ8_CUCMM|nr:4-hydroxy-tetrahydrodipicolinate synthase [Cucumis melo var. makuwa]TYK22106.1 4-hydroxy-tetrahydrodipicolinate synthase [Cucumis melo var. makuwa]